MKFLRPQDRLLVRRMSTLNRPPGRVEPAPAGRLRTVRCFVRATIPAADHWSLDSTPRAPGPGGWCHSRGASLGGESPAVVPLSVMWWSWRWGMIARGLGPSRYWEDTSVEVFPPTDGPVPEIDPSKPHPARIYDYGLGGKNHS